jgi:hypothetical protein
MKQIKTIRNLILVLCLGMMSHLAVAQNQTCNKFEVNSFKIKPSDLNLIYGYPVITDEKDVKFELELDINDGKLTTDSFVINITFNGYYNSGKPMQLYKVSKPVILGNSTIMGKEIQLAPKNIVKFKAGADLEGTVNKPAVITSVVVSVASLCNGKTAEMTQTFKLFKLKDGAITSVLASDDYFVEKSKLSNTFMNENISTDLFAVVIGLNNTKKDPPQNLFERLEESELAMTLGLAKGTGVFTWQIGTDKPFTQIVSPSEDKDGYWLFKNNVAIKDPKNPPVLVSYDLEFITLRNDTFKYSSVYKRKLADKKPWDYKVKMEAIAVDNPIFQPAGNVSNNILALSFPASSVTVTNNTLVFNRGPISTAVVGIIGATAVGKKNSNDSLSGATSISVTIQFDEPGDGRVFYHWGSVVSTSNPKFAINLDSLKLKNSTIQNVEIRMVNGKNDTIVYDMNGEFAKSLDGKTIFLLVEKSGKNKYDDPCKTKYKLKEIEYAESNAANLYSLQFKFNFEEKSDVPEVVEMVVEQKNCEGTAQYIKIALKYDAKSETYIGSQTIQQIQNCRWELKSGLITAYNSCKEKTVWSFDTNKVKTRGGLRTIALDLVVRADHY